MGGEKFARELKPEEWVRGVSRNTSPFLDQLSGVGVYRHSKDFGVDATIERVAVGKGFHQDMFFNKKSLQECGQRIVKAALSDKGFLKKFEKLNIERIEKLISVSEKIAESGVWEKIFKEYCKAWRELAPSLWITVILGRVINDLLVKDLSGRLSKSKEEIEEIISILTYPSRATPFKEEEIELLELCAEIQGFNYKTIDKNIERKLHGIYEKYRFIPVNYVGDAWSLGFFKNELQNLVENFDCAKKLEYLRNAHIETIRKRDLLEKTLSLTAKEQKEIEILRSNTYLNEIRKFAYCKANYLIREFLDKVAVDSGSRNWESVSYLSYEEILDLIKGKKQLEYRKKIRERKKLYVFTRTRDGKFIIFSGRDAELIDKKISQITAGKTITKGGILKGTIASKGKSVGNAKVLLGREDIHKVVKGDIIVAKMTSVDFIPAMRLASGFITNEGGISCHAAIVAREMGKPCLIGTGHATEFFKDGDVVELDAEKGIARKVSELSRKMFHVVEKEKKIQEVKHHVEQRRREDIVWLDSVNRNDTNLVGGKGANLGELSGKFSVPRGFCITVNVYEKFLKRNGLKERIDRLLKKINIEDTEIVERVSEHISKLIIEGKCPEELKTGVLKHYSDLGKGRVSVRSSANLEDMPFASFAGQHDTFLNVKGEKGLLDAVKKCFASLFTARAICYREANGMEHGLARMSVVVQEMVDSELSGVMFTIEPIDRKHLVIEIVKGLGENIVSGRVTPNKYVFGREHGRILNKQEKFGIDTNSLNQLARIGLEIERFFGKPQDVEFAIKSGKIFILQSRDITTL